MSLEEYLEKAKTDSSYYATASERMIKAIGEPTYIDSGTSPRLRRLFGTKKIAQYEVFKDFYGMESTIEQIVSYFKHAAQDLEESRQILYLLGPVGSAKSSLAERIKSLMEKQPIYTLAVQGKDGLEVSPIQETPLGLLDAEDSEELGIPETYLKIKPSPWAIKRSNEFGGDITKFKVVELYPNQFMQLGITKTEPGDENNQDISALVGKLDIRKLEFFKQDDPDAYAYSGGLCKGNQGILEFVEMFKAPIKVLHPLLTATQEHNYRGTEAISDIPFNGIVVSHSNESEWDKFKNNKNNEAFLDRVCVIRVPYCLQVDEEVKIYDKYLKHSKLKAAPCAPHTLETLARFSILTRITDPENSSIYAKLLVYNGQEVRDRFKEAKSLLEYKESADKNEAFYGLSTREAFKLLAKVFNADMQEVAADPVQMIIAIEEHIKNSRLSENEETTRLSFIKDFIASDYLKVLGEEIQTAYIESHEEFGQALFDRYVLLADYWVQDNEFRDPDTGHLLNRSDLNEELSIVEKLAGIGNPKDFRNEVVNFALRYKASNKGNNMSWKADPKMARVIKANMFDKIEDMLPIISFNTKRSTEDSGKHASFNKRMVDLGYTEKQVRRLVDWYLKYKRSL